MRYSILKRKSSKAERVVGEILKELHIPFRHRWKVGKYEVDFLVGNMTIDIDGHEQNQDRNYQLIEMGYVPIHFSNLEIKKNREIIKQELLKYVTFQSNFA